MSAENPNTKTAILALEKFLNSVFDFRYNVVTGVIEGKFRTDVEYHRVEDYELNSIVRACKTEGYPTNATTLLSLLISNFTPHYNPFLDYFGTLREWDGETDHITKLAETVSTTNDALWKMCFKKWFVAMAASILYDKVINHTVIVLSGPQGIGKTTWILNLIPEQLRKYIFSGTINPDNKDTLVLMAECMLINLDELENLNRRSLGSIKELITKNEIKLRRPYGRVNELMPRRASFAGSVNTINFLTDTTGSRRFLCFEVIGIDYEHQLVLDQAYSEAVALVKDGFKFWFEGHEIVEINKNNDKFRIVTAEEELLLSCFMPCEREEADYLLTTTEIFIQLQAYAKISLNPSGIIRLGKALHSNKFQRYKSKGVQRYAVKRKPQDDYSSHATTEIGLRLDN